MSANARETYDEIQGLNETGQAAILFETRPTSVSYSGPLPTRTRCHICGFAEVRTDEVEDRGVVFLAECPRCEHRWTSRVPIEQHQIVEHLRPVTSPLAIEDPQWITHSTQNPMSRSITVASRFRRVAARVARVTAPAA